MEKHSRPRALEALCLMSYIGSGAGLILYALAGIFFNRAGEIIVRFSSAHTITNISPGYFLILGVLFALSLRGVFNMWNLRKRGFYLYASAQLTIFFLPVIWMGIDAFSAVAMIFTALFIGAYATQWRYLVKR
jgi:hypothetical protein